MENNFIALANGFTRDGTFKFGKHKNKSFVEVATNLKEPDYFLWLRKNLKGKLDKELNEFIENNLDKLKSLPKISYYREGDWGDYGDSF
jgi:hypothetical protein